MMISRSWCPNNCPPVYVGNVSNIVAVKEGQLKGIGPKIGPVISKAPYLLAVAFMVVGYPRLAHWSNC